MHDCSPTALQLMNVSNSSGGKISIKQPQVFIYWWHISTVQYLLRTQLLQYKPFYLTCGFLQKCPSAVKLLSEAEKMFINENLSIT